MITTFKIFENLDKPEVGDYVIANNIPTMNNFLKNRNEIGIRIDNFLKNNIGKVYNIHKYIIAITYDNVPDDLLIDFGRINNIPTKCIHIDYTTYAKTKKELEIKLKTKKYNI